jgi:phospholipid/cholesterol/gamma-HCH transport system substrate-binding protein
VIMKINDTVKFPVDSSAKILTAGLLGDQYIGIEPGADDKNLADGDLIKQTQSAVVLENLIGQLIFNKAADAGSSNTPAPAPGASLAPAPAAPAVASGSKK